MFLLSNLAAVVLECVSNRNSGSGRRQEARRVHLRRLGKRLLSVPPPIHAEPARCALRETKVQSLLGEFSGARGFIFLKSGSRESW